MKITILGDYFGRRSWSRVRWSPLCGPGGAAVDVFDGPVRDPAHPLLQMDNVVASPHIGYVRREAYERQFTQIFEQIRAYAAGMPINVINPEVLRRG
jgi:D-3-phosphoglycerate dehydrogenase / 2-oxoglutarate reductase